MKKELIDFIKLRYIYILAYLYLFSSTFLFIIGNIRLIYALPLTILSIIALYHAIKKCPIMEQNLFDNKRIWIIILLIICWIIYGGVGGFIWQNSWDHKFRNAIFKDLVNYSWPVVNSQNALVYYYGFWLVPSIFGKTLGLTFGYITQTIWAITGTFIAYGLLCQWLKSVKITNVIILILYSGLDVFLYFLFSGFSISESLTNIFNGKHIELITIYFNSSSNTTLIFWLYNQIIPLWIGMLLILKQTSNKSLAFIYSLLFIYSPFPLLALLPVVIYLFFKGIKINNLKKTIINILHDLFTLDNITAFLIVSLIALFYKTNIAASQISFLYLNSKVLISFLAYFFFEYIIYLIFIYNKHKDDMVLNILIIFSIIAPFIRLGHSFDFAYRTCIPLAFYIMLLVMKELGDSSTHISIKICLIIILSLGALTPISEFLRTYNKEKKVLNHQLIARSEALPSVFEKKDNECYENFIGDKKTFFYKYLAKKNT